ncbi:hypothetical protein ACFLT4_03150 [Chloroflexota bacterium]
MKYKRVVVSRKGPPEVLQVVEGELAEPGVGEDRIDIEGSLPIANGAIVSSQSELTLQ